MIKFQLINGIYENQVKKKKRKERKKECVENDGFCNRFKNYWISMDFCVIIACERMTQKPTTLILWIHGYPWVSFVHFTFIKKERKKTEIFLLFRICFRLVVDFYTNLMDLICQIKTTTTIQRIVQDHFVCAVKRGKKIKFQNSIFFLFIVRNSLNVYLFFRFSSLQFNEGFFFRLLFARVVLPIKWQRNI